MSQHEGDRPGAGDELTEPLVDPRAPWEELIEDPAAPRKLLAVMFTDIVGSTELATGLGDKRWRELVDQHHAAIRAQIARFGGREVDTAGDAFFATFELPVRAVDCALESMRAVRRLGLRIRAGVHMGECVISNGAVRGVTVHIGARVGAKARGDELLVSSTVRDILAGAGLKFLDRGEQTLKGVEGRWRLYAVEPRERDSEADLPPLLELEIAKPPTPWFKQRRIAIAAATAFAVLIGAVAFVTLSGPGGLSSVAADSVARIDAASGDVESTIKVDRRPVGVATASDGSIWVANSIDRNVTRIETSGPREGQTRSTRVGPGPIAIAAGGRNVYVANADGGDVSRVSIDTNDEVGDRIRAGNGLAAVAYGAGALWVANATDGTVVRLDPTSGKTQFEIPVAPALRGLAVTADAVWVTSESAGTLTQIDPKSGVIVRVITVGHGPTAVAASERAVWVVNSTDRAAVRVDIRSGRVTASQRVGRGARAVAIAGDHVFVANEQDGTVSMLDAGSGRLLRTIELRNAPMGLAAAGDAVWVSVRGGISSYRGGTLKVGSALGDINSFDPGGPVPVPDFYIPVLSMVYDGLTAFKKTGGPEGNELVPNLAEEIRPPTNDGTTYTFKLRSGLVYSDGTPVKASDVRSSFERPFLIEGSYAPAFLSILKGADGCSPKACDLSAGVVPDDRAGTVIFHLRRAFADFPYHLALPSLSIVPGKTPRKDIGLTLVPGTGPYRFATVDAKPNSEGVTTARRIVLERNPRFEPRELAQPDGYADRIDIALELDRDDAREAVGNDRYDLMLEHPEVGLKDLLIERPSQVHLIDMPWNLLIVLNNRVPPFNNVKARQALNYAIDRRALINASDDLIFSDISCQLLPKNTVGFVPYCPYTKGPNPSQLWRGPDLDTARRLVRESGTQGQKVTVWTLAGDSPPAQRREPRVRILADTLNRIGYVATIKAVEEPDYFGGFSEPNHSRQITLSGWASDYPGAGNFVLPLATCPQTIARLGGNVEASNWSRFCSPTIDALTEKALQIPPGDSARSRDEWAKVDRALTDTAAFVPWANLRNAILTSRRAGNVQGHATYLLLLSQMWVVEEPKATPT